MDDKVYRSRDFETKAHQRYLRDLLESLQRDEQATDPSHADGAKGKDHRAFSALQTASDLIDAVAGWAVDHVYGLSLAGRKMLPWQPMATANHPDYLESQTFADAHEHECRGGIAIEEDHAPGSAYERRLVLRNLIFAGAGALPDWLRRELLEALDALDAGAVMPLLQATRREGAEFRKAKARLALVAIINFRSRAFSSSKKEERRFVGQAIGRDEETLKDWEKDLKKSCLGSLEVRRTIAFALNAASSVRHARKLRDIGKQISDREQTAADCHEKRYGGEALKAAVLVWQRAEGYGGGTA